MSNTIRKGIISPDLYTNGTEEVFMAGNVAALSGKLNQSTYEQTLTEFDHSIVLFWLLFCEVAIILSSLIFSQSNLSNLPRS